MIARIQRWWRGKPAQRPELSKDLLEAYRLTFRTPHGERVLGHLLERVYCTAYEGTDTWEAAVHNGRRSLVQDIFENIEQAERGTRDEPASRAHAIPAGAYDGGPSHA